jgi:uncharacterized protein (TIGR00251 family)
MTHDLTLMVRVVPRASKSEVVGMVEGHLKLRIAAPPVDGAANAELIRLLSRYFDVPKRNVELVSGETSRVKKVRVSGLKELQMKPFLNGPL